MRLRPGAAGLPAALALGLAACAASTDYLEYRPSGSPQAVADRLFTAIRGCWFAEDEKAFADYALEAELASHSNRPRILLVGADDRGGLPRLVVEASREKGRTSVKLFGPLLATPLGPRAQTDVARWSRGSTACA
jgi:hypothetical protein